MKEYRRSKHRHNRHRHDDSVTSPPSHRRSRRRDRERDGRKRSKRSRSWTRYSSRDRGAIEQSTVDLSKEEHYHRIRQPRSHTSTKKEQDDESIFYRTFVQDAFTLMILSKPLSKSWALGITSTAIQLTFWGLLFYSLYQENASSCSEALDGTVVGKNCIPFNMPYYVPIDVTIAQAIAIPLVVLMQGDTITAVENLSTLWYSLGTWETAIFREEKSENDHTTIDTNSDYYENELEIGTISQSDSEFEDEKEIITVVRRKTGKCLWAIRILVPCMLQLSVGIMSLAGSFILIGRSDHVLSLLEDFAALLVVNGIDDIAFQAAERGQFGKYLSRKAAEATTVKYPDHRSSCFRIGTWVVPMVAMYVAWAVVIVHGQLSGNLLRLKYPYCYANNIAWLGDGICDDAYTDFLNTAECDWDGGDCVVAEYPSCHADPRWIGDGVCFELYPYNTAACGYDGGDCIFHNVPGFPDCFVTYPGQINNTVCWDYPPYNTKECGYDGGDCNVTSVAGYPDCFVQSPEFIGNGLCNSYPPYNTIECGFDGGDCAYYPVEGLDGCYVHYEEALGNGFCDSYFQNGNYNSEECGYDLGDCLMEYYPDCVGVNPIEIGNGICRNYPPYNTADCGFDGGDCLAFHPV